MKSAFFAAFVLLVFSTASAQHDAQRNAVQWIAKERYDKLASEFANPKVDAGESETLFVEMLALLAQDDIEGALVFARKAVDAGLPFDRLRVGPRQLLEKLHDQPEYQEWENSEERSLVVHGPMLGNVTDSSASIWIRTAEEVESINIVHQPMGARGLLVSEYVSATAENDYTAVIKLEELFSDTVYQCWLKIDGEDVYPDGFQIRTYPEKGAPAKFEIAFGGGAGFIPEWEYMWNTIASFEPEAMLMLGDNVYIDDPEHVLTHHYCYYRRQCRPEWRSLIRRTPMYSIWDDHDFGDNDCIPGPDIAKPAWKREVWNVFRQNWVNPGYGGGEEQPGCWYTFSIGDVQLFLLDGRYYRDLKGGSMLGPVQKQWLLESLAASKATFKLLVSPVPFSPDIKPGSKDPWDGYPEEREEIFSTITEKGIEGVFLVAADRHRTDLRKISRPDGYDLYEFESSRLTNKHTHKVVKTEGLVWGYSDTCSFGLMEFDTTAEDPQVTFRCIDIDGEEIHRHVLKRSELVGRPAAPGDR